MTIIERQSKIADLIRPLQMGEEIAPGHRAWMDEQIRETLARKERGEIGYSPVEDIRGKFGL